MLKPVFINLLTPNKYQFLALILLVFILVAYLISIQAQGEASKTQAQQKGFPDLINGLKAT